MLRRLLYDKDDNGGGGSPDDKPAKDPQELAGELARRREENDKLKQRLSELEEQERKRQEEQEKAEAERRKKAGEFETVEADLRKKIADLEAETSGYKERLNVFVSQAEQELEAMLKDHDGADNIRSQLEGLPVEKQLGLVKTLLPQATQQQRGPTGTPKPGKPGPGEPNVPDEIKALAQADAARLHPGDAEKQQKYVTRFLATYQTVRTERESTVALPGARAPGGAL